LTDPGMRKGNKKALRHSLYQMCPEQKPDPQKGFLTPMQISTQHIISTHKK